MRPFHKQILDTNRHHLKSIENGTIRGVNENDFSEIQKFYVNPHAGSVNEIDFDSVANLIKSCYMWYDDYCARTNTRELQMQDIALLEKYRNALNGDRGIGSWYKDFFRIMVLYYDPHYAYPQHLDTMAVYELVRNVYKHYDGKEQAFNSIEIDEPERKLAVTYNGKN